MCEKTRTHPGGHASGQDVDIRDDKNVTVMGDPLLVQRATPAAVARDSVDVEVLFIEHRRRLVNLAASSSRCRIGARGRATWPYLQSRSFTSSKLMTPTSRSGLALDVGEKVRQCPRGCRLS